MKIRVSLLTLMFVLAASFGIYSLAIAEGSTATDSEKVTDLLRSSKSEAAQVSRDAATMKSMVASKVSLQSHSSQIRAMADHANELVSTVNELNGARMEASPWQEQAIDRITPLLDELATNLNATIKYMTENQSRANTPEFEDYVDANAELSEELSVLVSDYVSYNMTKDRFQRLSEKLETPQD